ncbi:MAG: 2-dehydropantoate 2-reductase [Dehalococcoidia bacterium]
MFKRIGIVGAGAIGGNIGGMLTLAGYDVTLVDMWPENVEAIRHNGLKITRPQDELTAPARAIHIHELQYIEQPFDVAFIAVKSYDTEWATALILPYLTPGAPVLSVQNAINDDRVAAVAGRERTVGCITTIGAGCYEPGHVVRTDSYPLGFKIGELDGSETERAQEITALMGHVADAKLTTNLWGERWSKLGVNCMTNSLAGLTGYGTAQVRTIPEVRRVAVQIGAETFRVAAKLGMEVGLVYGAESSLYIDAAEGRRVEELELVMMGQANGAGNGKPSLLQDVLKGRRTEIDYLNGYVAEKGRETGIPTPFNNCVVEIFHRLGIGFKPDPRHIEPLVAMV